MWIKFAVKNRLSYASRARGRCVLSASSVQKWSLGSLTAERSITLIFPTVPTLPCPTLPCPARIVPLEGV